MDKLEEIFQMQDALNRRIGVNLPPPTDEEKAKLKEHLLRGRDEALIAGSADKKHEKFRLAKGRIGNYLSARGYDLKRASDEWAAKRKAKS